MNLFDFITADFITQPRRAPGSCFRCGSTSHVIRNCPVPDRRQPMVAAVQGNDNETSHLDSGENENFVQLEVYQEVSVAFKRNNVWSPGLIITSLFGSGSSKSFIN